MKEQMILEAAQKRFGLFGVEKTSMREIAEDLNLSKASLYYYYPDKESLYRAVVEKEQDEFIRDILERISVLGKAELMLKEYAAARLSYFRGLLNLSRLRLQAFSDLKPVLKDTMLAFREREKEIIIRILTTGRSEGVFYVDDPEQTADLFLDLLKGVRMTILSNKSFMVIEESEFASYGEKTDAIADFFIRGLKYNPVK